MKLDINNYPGAKGGSGITQWIINHIPETNVFIEGFAGSGKISFELIQHIKPAVKIFLNEIYQPVWQQLRDVSHLHTKLIIQHIDSVEYYYNQCIDGHTFKHCVFYFDPPYLLNTRKNNRKLYGHEWRESDHKRFLNLVDKLHRAGAKIIISHYDCDLYNENLFWWTTDTMNTMTRGGKATEKIWMNYDIECYNLLCTKFVGKNYVDRQRINRRKESYKNKFLNMPIHERQAILEHIQKHL